MPNGEHIKKEFTYEGKDIQANNIKICYKKSNNKTDIEIVTYDVNTPVPFEDDSDRIYSFVEIMPNFPGGENEMREFINKNLRYPKKAQENGIQGRVFVRFVVQADGKITDIQVVRGIHPLLDEEAIRIIKLMPAWNPGRQDGKPVNTIYTLPLIFKLT